MFKLEKERQKKRVLSILVHKLVSCHVRSPKKIWEGQGPRNKKEKKWKG